MAHRTFRRRDFLRLTVVSAMASAAVPLAGCSSDTKAAASGPGSGDGGNGGNGDGGSPSTGEAPHVATAAELAIFPQGVASGDPRPDSVILWTRVQAAGDGGAPGDVAVTYEVATDLAFKDVVAKGELTATASADGTVRLKVTKLAALSFYYYRFTALGTTSPIGRTKTAPKDDADVPARFAFAACQDFVGRYYYAWKVLADEDAVDFVVFLGDYIYETAGDPAFQTPTDARKIVLPDGLDLGGGGLAAKTLADYRALYRQYRSDENLRRAHQLFPFFCIWDDHEFGDDCWQDHQNHFAGAQGDEQDTAGREDADQAWFEFQPADVHYDDTASYPNDIQIYRNLRYGKHMELFLTDERYYRDDHVIPEGPTDASVAKLTQNSSVGARIFVLKSGFDVKEAAKKPTLLGANQKTWFLDAVKASTATWKVWGNEVQLAQMVVNLSSFPKVPAPFNDLFYLTVDQWDGYRTERAEILDALKGVENLVVVTGDIHAFYASELHVDFDAPGATPVAVEYVVAGITSQAIAPAAQSVIAANTLYSSLGLLDLIPQWDTLLPQASPHYRYANSFSNGIGVCNLTPEAVEVTFIIVGDVTLPTSDGKIERVKLRTAAGSRKVERV